MLEQNLSARNAEGIDNHQGQKSEITAVRPDGHCMFDGGKKASPEGSGTAVLATTEEAELCSGLSLCRGLLRFMNGLLRPG